MKKILIFCGLIMFSFSAWAQNPHTCDHLEIGEIEFELGSSEGVLLDINLSGETIYTAFGFDLYLPAGYEYDLGGSSDWNDAIDAVVGNYAIYPFSGSRNKVYSHTLSANIQQDGALRITTLSSSSAEFLSTNGTIVSVYVKTTPYAKPGAASIQIKNCFFVTSDGTKYVTDDITISDKVSATSTTSIPFSVNGSNHWSTCILPFTCDIPDGVVAYSANEVDGDNLLLKTADSFEAYKPYVLYSENGYSGTLSGTVDPEQYPVEGFVTDGYLNGAIVPQQITEGFVMQKLDGEVKFYICNNGTYNIPAGKCWLSALGDDARSIGFKFDNDETAITEINGQSKSNSLFDLTGRRVLNPSKGIYIENGKKVLK